MRDPGNNTAGRSISNLGQILVLSKADFQRYGAAFYQRDFLEELEKQTAYSIYGPGFPGFDKADDIKAVFSKVGFVPDTVITAHMWLADDPAAPLNPMPNLHLSEFSGRKIGVINKEYSRGSKKLQWFHKHRFHRVFSHHPYPQVFRKTEDLDIRFLPFAAKPDRFLNFTNDRHIDFGFSGVLANPLFSDQQSGFRRELMREIFHCFRDFAVVPKKKWQSFKIEWRSWSGDFISDKLSRVDPRRRRLQTAAYATALARSKLWLGSPSVAGIISTRYFECMMAGSVVMSEPSLGLQKLFGDDTIVFVGSIEEFEEKFLWFLANPEILQARAARVRTQAIEHHSWEMRVHQFLDESAE